MPSARAVARCVSLLVAGIAAAGALAGPAAALTLTSPLAPVGTATGCVRDPAAGVAGCPQQAPGLLQASALAVLDASGRGMAVASPEADAVALLGLDPATGAITAGSCVQAPDGTSCPAKAVGLHGADALATVPGHRLLVGALDDYAVVELAGLRETACVSGIALAGCGRVPGLGDVTALAADPTGRSVYAISPGLDAGLDTVVALARDHGRLTAVHGPGRCVQSLGSTPARCPLRVPGLEGPVAAAVSPDGRSVYVVSRASSAVVALARNPKTGALSSINCIGDLRRVGDSDSPCARRAPAMQGADAVAVAPDGRTVYVAAADPGGVLALRRNRLTGALVGPVGCLSALPTATCATVPSVQGARAVVVAPGGRAIDVAADAADAITSVGLVGATGGFAPIGPSASVDAPVQFPTALTAAGRWLYAASSYSDGVFAIAQASP
jgi:hypothetical protein